jgi:outer membrane murein-binding lipoprotein Lpp
MKITLASALMATLLLCGCSAKGRIQNHIPANAGAYEDAEGYSVLSMLVSGSSAKTRADAIRINMVTHVESVNGTHSLEDCMKIPEEFREAANDYERRANTALVLKKKFTLRTAYDLVGETRITGSGVRSAPAAGSDVSVKTSGGTFYLSPVGFDANRTHAIAYENYLCGNRCGWGGFHLLVKNGGRWEEAKDVGGCTWNY